MTGSGYWRHASQDGGLSVRLPLALSWQFVPRKDEAEPHRHEKTWLNYRGMKSLLNGIQSLENKGQQGLVEMKKADCSFVSSGHILHCIAECQCLKHERSLNLQKENLVEFRGQSQIRAMCEDRFLLQLFLFATSPPPPINLIFF